MNELGLDTNQAISWFPPTQDTPYVLVRVNPLHSNEWAAALRDAVRRCYVTDEVVRTQAQALEQQLGGTFETRQSAIINSKLPDAGATMAGDFGEILIYTYQAARAFPRTPIGPKKWRLKQDRTKPAPCSDVVHFILPSWPTATNQDEVLCAEVKMKSTNGNSTPIQDAIADCEKDRTSRLSRTLLWLRERALTENLGQVEIAHLNRFINATDYPPAVKTFRAVAVICNSLLNAELPNAPQQVSPDYELVVVAVPNLHAVYNAVFEAAKTSTLPPLPQP